MITWLYGVYFFSFFLLVRVEFSWSALSFGDILQFSLLLLFVILWSFIYYHFDIIWFSQSSVLHSQPKSTVGTPAHIAPEVLLKKEYDGKVILRERTSIVLLYGAWFLTVWNHYASNYLMIYKTCTQWSTLKGWKIITEIINSL